MKILISVFLLFTLAACGGGCGGGGSSSVAGGSTVADNSPSPAVKAVKSTVDYAPIYLAIAAGSYNVMCGRNDRPRIATSVKISSDGLLTPWRGKALDLKSTLFSFGRNMSDRPAGGFIAAIGGFTLTQTAWSVTSEGAVNSGDLSPGATADSVLGSGDLLGLDPKLASVLSCDGSTEAAALSAKSAYAAFAKFIDAPNTALLCLAPNSTTGIYTETSNETYEISNGELRFKGQAISLVTGIKKESIADGGGLKPVTDANGATIYTRIISYSVDKLDGTNISLVINEFGETISLAYKVGTGPLLNCLRAA